MVVKLLWGIRDLFKLLPVFTDCQDVYDNHGGKNYPGYSYIMIQPYTATMPFEVCCKMTNDSGKLF